MRPAEERLEDDMAEAEAALRTLLAHFETLAFDRIDAMLDERAIFEFPFSTHEQGRRIEGRAAIIDYLNAAMASFVTSMRFTVDAVHACADPDWAIAEYRSTGTLKAGGTYANRYAGLVRVKGDRLLLFREYFNPSATIVEAGDAA